MMHCACKTDADACEYFAGSGGVNPWSGRRLDPTKRRHAQIESFCDAVSSGGDGKRRKVDGLPAKSRRHCPCASDDAACRMFAKTSYNPRTGRKISKRKTRKRLEIEQFCAGVAGALRREAEAAEAHVEAEVALADAIESASAPAISRARVEAERAREEHYEAHEAALAAEPGPDEMGAEIEEAEARAAAASAIARAGPLSAFVAAAPGAEMTLITTEPIAAGTAIAPAAAPGDIGSMAMLAAPSGRPNAEIVDGELIATKKIWPGPIVASATSRSLEKPAEPPGVPPPAFSHLPRWTRLSCHWDTFAASVLACYIARPEGKQKALETYAASFDDAGSIASAQDVRSAYRQRYAMFDDMLHLLADADVPARAAMAAHTSMRRALSSDCEFGGLDQWVHVFSELFAMRLTCPEGAEAPSPRLMFRAKRGVLDVGTALLYGFAEMQRKYGACHLGILPPLVCCQAYDDVLEADDRKRRVEKFEFAAPRGKSLAECDREFMLSWNAAQPAVTTRFRLCALANLEAGHWTAFLRAGTRWWFYDGMARSVEAVPPGAIMGGQTCFLAKNAIE